MHPLQAPVRSCDESTERKSDTTVGEKGRPQSDGNRSPQNASTSQQLEQFASYVVYFMITEFMQFV